MPPVGPDRSPASEPSRPQATSSSERRRTPRTKPAGLTYVKLEPDNGGRLLDVCESGIGFQVVAPVEETGRIQLWFVLDSERHIEVSGELAWIDDTKRSGGLKFTRPSKQARQQLRAWLSHQRPGSELAHRSVNASHQIRLRRWPQRNPSPAPITFLTKVNSNASFIAFRTATPLHSRVYSIQFSPLFRPLIPKTSSPIPRSQATNFKRSRRRLKSKQAASSKNWRKIMLWRCLPSKLPLRFHLRFVRPIPRRFRLCLQLARLSFAATLLFGPRRSSKLPARLRASYPPVPPPVARRKIYRRKIRAVQNCGRSRKRHVEHPPPRHLCRRFRLAAYRHS